MSENSTNNILESDGSSVKFYKKKNRGKKRKTCCYVDYDQTTGEDDAIQSAASLTWPSMAPSVQLDPSAFAKHSTRESVSYDDEDRPTATLSSDAVAPPIVRGRFYNNQFSVNQTHAYTSSSRPKNLPVFPKEHQISSFHSSSLLSCVDPTVVASEKKEIFKKPDPEQVNTSAKERKTLTTKQRRRIQRKKHYKELQKKQEEQAKQRANATKPLRPCKYYQGGNCNKGKNCTFSHDCEIIRKPELCKFYLLSTCTKGLACPYYHGDWPCKFFHVFKFCMNGEACKFSHEPLTDKSRELLDKAMAGSDTSAAVKTGQQLSSDVAKENCLSNGNTQHAVNYNAPVMPQHVTTSCHPVTNTSTCLPCPHSSGHQLPANTAAVSMTLQQKVYRLNLIEFEKPVIRELPPYIDMNDPRWSADPRVQPSDPRVRPCIQHTATAITEHTTTNPIGLAFYSSGGDTGRSDAACVVKPADISGADMGTSNHLSSTGDRVTDVATVHVNKAGDCSPVESRPVNSVCDVSSSVKCENSPNLPHKLENFPSAVVKAEPVDSCDAASAAVARHTFQHNFSWLSVTRSSGVQKLSHAKN